MIKFKVVVCKKYTTKKIKYGSSKSSEDSECTGLIFMEPMIKQLPDVDVIHIGYSPCQLGTRDSN